MGKSKFHQQRIILTREKEGKEEKGAIKAEAKRPSIIAEKVFSLLLILLWRRKSALVCLRQYWSWTSPIGQIMLQRWSPSCFRLMIKQELMRYMYKRVVLRHPVNSSNNQVPAMMGTMMMMMRRRRMRRMRMWWRKRMPSLRLLGIS